MRSLTPIVYPDGSQQASAGASVTSSVPPANPATAASIGSSSEAARADHTHRSPFIVSTTAPLSPLSGDVWLVV